MSWLAVSAVSLAGRCRCGGRLLRYRLNGVWVKKCSNCGRIVQDV